MLEYGRNGIFMRIVVILLLVFVSYSKGMTSNDELKLLEYQNQIVRLYEYVSSVDTKNELLKAKVIENEKYYQKILENESKKFDVYLKQEQDNHNVIVDDLFNMFYVIITLITMGILFLGFILNFFGRKMIKKLIYKQIKEDFNEEITFRQIEQLKENSKFTKLVRDIIEEQSASDDDVVGDPL